MSEYKAGMRVGIDESLNGDDDYPYAGVGRLVSKAPNSNIWTVNLEWLIDRDGKKICGVGEEYTIFETEISGVLDD